MAKKEKLLVMDISADTDERPVNMLDEQKQPKESRMSKEEEDTVGFLLRRFDDMRRKRS